MILQWFAEMFYKIFTLLFSNIHVPEFPDELTAIMDYLDMIISNGVGLLTFFIPYSALQACCTVILAIMAVENIYYPVMWMLKKIPAVGIK